jgi:hypothetical protein
VPDVSYVADPNTGLYVYCSTYSWPYVWFQVGGTSAGAPQWAALLALANQGRVLALSGNSDLYTSTVAGSPGTINPANFMDISSGTNGADPDDISVAGYDLVTGLGSPLANNLVPALSGPPPQPPATPTVNATGGIGQISLSWNSVTGATSYNVMRSTSPGTETILTTGVTTTSYTDKNVAVGMTYYYQVSGVNSGGQGPSSQEKSATPTPPPDFSISANPASQTVGRGSATTYIISIVPLGGFTGSVSLNVSGLPSRSSASFSPNPVAVSSGGTSTLTVGTTSRTPSGTRTLTITATSGSLRHTQTVTLNVQ